MKTREGRPPVTAKTIQYICHDMLGLDDWTPELADHPDTWEVLNKCQSLLEVAYLVGAHHFMTRTADEMVLPASFGTVLAVNDSCYRAVWFMEPWYGFGMKGGPSAMALIPQYPVGRYAVDFAVAVGDDNGSPRWSIQSLVEINGYAVHRARRNADERRAHAIEKISSVPVLQFFEETDNPLTWFKVVIDQYHGDATG